jgi:hypothetical protein
MVLVSNSIQIRALGRIFGPKRDEVEGVWEEK